MGTRATLSCVRPCFMVRQDQQALVTGHKARQNKAVPLLLNVNLQT